MREAGDDIAADPGLGEHLADRCSQPDRTKRKMSVTELSQRVDLSMANISILKNGRAKAVRFSTLDAIREALDSQPGDILQNVPGDA